MKTAKLFKNGGSQAVRLPEEFRFEGESVFVKKIGKTVVLLPVEDAWGPLFRSLDKFSADFMNKREQPEQPNREDIFS